MLNSFTSLCIFYKIKNLKISFNLVLNVMETRMLFSSLWFQLSLLLMSFSIKFSHWFSWALSCSQLCLYLSFCLSQLFYSYFTFLHNTLFFGNFLIRLLFLILRFNNLRRIINIFYPLLSHCWLYTYNNNS